MIVPILEKVATEQMGKLLVAKVNTDENPEWATRFGVQGIPTTLFVDKSEIVHQQAGVMPKPMFGKVLDAFLTLVSEED
jgi:thioredoxin 1